MEINGPLVVPLSSPGHTLDSSGGKGLNLALLTMAGFHVPGGFVLTSAAYQRFVEVNHLLPLIQAGLAALTDGPESLEETSKRIREVFSEGFIPEEIKSGILAAYRQLGNGAVAVRSSATTEDLPELSFAGQQDTYLNITNEDDLLKRVVDCWSSLWTARAIGYRLRQHVPQEGIFLAVVVQRMVQSDVSGVLFTANPLSGLRSEMVIDATLGLGEALVSGLVEPDHYTVDMLTKNVSEKKLGAKGISIRPMVGGGVERVAEHSATSQALIDEQILELVEVGQRAQDYFGSPQDIEWAFCHDQLFLLQSRPITSLYPLPADVGAGPLKVFSSFASVQGIMDPITPIGQSALKSIFATVAGLFGLRRTEETQNALYTAGERLWANITPLIKNSLGKKIIPVVLEYVEPTIRLSFLQIMDDPRLQPEREGVSFRGRLRLLRFILPVAGNVLLNLLFPSARRKYIVNRGEVILKRLDLLLSTIHGNPFEKLARQARVLSLFTEKYLCRTFILFVSGVASGMVSWNALSMLFSKFYQAEPEKKEHFSGLILQMTRGMPFNPTTEMDLDLWGMAQSIHRDELSLQAMTESSPGELSQRYLAAELPSVLTQEIRRFLDRYGGRGFGEIDLGRNRWAENPQHVFEMLSSFMQIKYFENSPDAVFGRSVAIATESKEQLISAARALPGGFIKARVVRFFSDRMRKLMGMRESPKFFVVRMMWAIHRELLKTGREFVELGELEHADDLFYLTFPELSAFAAKSERNWRELIFERRALYQKEMQRRQLPHLFLSDGRAFYEGMSSPIGVGASSLMGSPVSPGVVEALVRVVRDPGAAGLIPGEIMVCPGTDPSWTPLFMAASGLVMEVGGMMTHGAVVAREYGIPAVVGVTNATARLVTGQKIRLNGSNGEITLLDDK